MEAIGYQRDAIIGIINMTLNAVKLTGLCLLVGLLMLVLAWLTALVIGGLVAFMVFGTIFLGCGPY